MNDENEVDGVCLVRLHSEFCDLRRFSGRRVNPSYIYGEILCSQFRMLISYF